MTADTNPGIRDPMDLMDDEAIRELAQKSLEAILSPNLDWEVRHDTARLADPLPTDAEVESMLEGLTPSVDTEDGVVHAELDSRQVRSMGRDIGDAFRGAEEKLETLSSLNGEEFLNGLERSVGWSVAHNLVDHPDLEVERWMEMAESMGLSNQARDVLMERGGPEALGRWWTHARPLEEDWSMAFYAFRRLVERRQYTRALPWLEPLLQARLPEPEDKPPQRRFGQPRPMATTQYRNDAMDAIWGKLVSLHYGEGGEIQNAGRIELIRGIEQSLTGDMLLLDWEDLLRSDNRDNTLAPPDVVRDRLTRIAQNHPRAYARWKESPAPENPSSRQDDFKRIAVTFRDGQKHLDLHSISKVLEGADPTHLYEVMAALGAVSRELGLDDGYEAQAVASSMDVAWGEARAAAPRLRF